MMLALEFPSVPHLTIWPTIFGEDWWAVNKVVLMFWAAAIIVIGFFILASKRGLVPTGVQNLGEMAVEFIENGIIRQTMGADGLSFAPFLLTLFTFILTLNVVGLLPGVQMPANARIALPMFMAVVVWLVYVSVGVVKQGPFGYLKSILLPPGVPLLIRPLVALIEFISVLFVRPFALMVRLFANLLAGHLILVSFAVLSAALWESTKIFAIAPMALLVALTGFELLVAFLQAYIFTILASVFIGEAMHPHH